MIGFLQVKFSCLSDFFLENIELDPRLKISRKNPLQKKLVNFHLTIFKQICNIFIFDSLKRATPFEFVQPAT